MFCVQNPENQLTIIVFSIIVKIFSLKIIIFSQKVTNQILFQVKCIKIAKFL